MQQVDAREHKLTEADMQADAADASKWKQRKSKTFVVAKETQADRQAEKADMNRH